MRKNNLVIMGVIYIIIFIQLFNGVFINIFAEVANQNKGTRHSGDSIDASFGTTPTIDGNISSSEWTDANSIQFGRFDGITIYFKHNSHSD